MSGHSGSMKSYVTGFILSLVCTIIPYAAVSGEAKPKELVYVALAVFAILQVFIQLVFFLHLGQEKRPRLQRLSFGFMTLVVVIVVFGSLWIMNNLDYHMMSPEETDSYIKYEEAIDPNAQ